MISSFVGLVACSWAATIDDQIIFLFSLSCNTPIFVTLLGISKLNKSTCALRHNATFLSSVWTPSVCSDSVLKGGGFRNSVQMLSKAPQNYKSVNGRSYLIRCSLTTSEEWQYLCCGRYALWLCWTGNVRCRWLPWRKGKDPGVNTLRMAIM